VEGSGRRSTTGPIASAIELRHLSALLALARDPQITRAALTLGVTRTTLSRLIADLEALIGVPLVKRTRRTAELTCAGRSLLAGADDALRAIDRGVTQARSLAARAPTLGLQTSVGHRWLGDLKRTLAAAGESVVVRRHDLAEGFLPLKARVDAMIGPLPIVPPSELRHVVLGSTRPHVALRAGHPAARSRAVGLEALRGQPLVVPPLAEVWWRDLELIFRAQGVPLTPGATADSMHEALALVADGAGWSYAPACEDFHPWDGVVLRPLAGVAPTRVALAWNAEHEARAAVLVDALRLAATTAARPHIAAAS